jgi:hypothetical protein
MGEALGMQAMAPTVKRRNLLRNRAPRMPLGPPDAALQQEQCEHTFLPWPPTDYHRPPKATTNPQGLPPPKSCDAFMHAFGPPFAKRGWQTLQRAGALPCHCWCPEPALNA